MLNIDRSDRDEAMAFRTTIKVMVLDNKKDLLNYVGDFLKSRSYGVTCVESAGSALRIFFEKKDTFDLLLIDGDLRDVDVITFLWLIKDMNILSIVMREEADDDFLLKVIKNGAFSVMKRPLTDDLVVQLRRHVIRERIHKLHKCRMHYESESKEPESTSSSGRRKTVQGLENESCGATKKICLEWTKELHTKFIKAVQKLGEGKCFPREILDTMKVPGLTRMQVASHLQKCREYGWNFNEKRGPTSSLKTSTFSTNISQEVGFRRFGRMPPVAKPVDNEEERTTHVDASFSSNGVYMDVNHMNNQSVHDSSSGFGFQNSGQVLTSPSVGQGSYCHIFPQNDQVSADFFDFGNDINGNESLAYMQLNVLGKNYNCISEQSYPYYDQVIPNQVTSLCNNHMSREVGELDTLVLYHDYFQK